MTAAALAFAPTVSAHNPQCVAQEPIVITPGNCVHFATSYADALFCIATGGSYSWEYHLCFY